MTSENSHRIEISDQQQRSLDFADCTNVAQMIVDDFGFDQSEISIAFVDDPTIRDLNKQYLNHDYETDVISFVLEESETALTGQLLVSTDTAEKMGQQIGVPMEHEVLLYVIHGMLHLVGFDDADPESAEKMRAAEADYLGRFGIKHHWEPSQ
jgi:probable rRNA maturation factor